MNFDSLTAIKSIRGPKVQDFNIEWKPDKGAFRFSDQMYESMNLEYNSLEQHDDINKDTGEVSRVFLAVCPGNDGVFFKKQKGIKGKSFKNTKLSESCLKIRLSRESIDLIYRGDKGDLAMYELVERLQIADDDQPQDDEQTDSLQPNDEEEEIENSPIKDKF